LTASEAGTYNSSRQLTLQLVANANLLMRAPPKVLTSEADTTGWIVKGSMPLLHEHPLRSMSVSRSIEGLGVPPASGVGQNIRNLT
jgi:hypothetical protein